MINHSSIQCITFDLDDTLWDCLPVIECAEQALHSWFTEHFPRIANNYTVDGLREQRQSLSQRYPHLLYDLMQLRRLSLQELAEEYDYPQTLAEQALLVFMEHRNRVTLYDDVIPTLQHLKDAYTLGAITNGNAQLDVIGIDHLFDFVVYAADAGAAKPASRIFHTALESAGIEAHLSVHVGDDPHTDVYGAAQVGMRTVWFNRRRETWTAEHKPEAEIHSLDELHGVLTEFG